MHDFGSCSPNDTIDWQMWVKNTGSANLVIDSVELEPPFAVVSPTLPETISSSDSSEFTIRFNPPDIGYFSDTMRIYSNDPESPVTQIYLSGKVSPIIILSDTMHNFGSCTLYDTISWKTKVKNAGTANLTIDSVKIKTPFECISPPLPHTILPGDSTEFTIIFNPQDTGNFFDTMKIYSNDIDEPVTEIYLSGRGIGSNIVLSDTLHDFGSCLLYGIIYWKMKVWNKGNIDLIIDSVKVNSPFFVTSPSFPQTIKPDGRLELTLCFNPQDTGNFVDTMKIYSNDPDKPVAKVVLIASCVGLQEMLPKTFKVSNTPNPFSNFTKIKYQLPEEEKVRIEIIDITGRLIKVLVDEKKKPGFYSVTWQGKDTQGRNVPPGIYFYLIKAGKNRAIKKMIKLK